MILNKTTGKVISRKEMVCTSRLSQARGLMCRKRQNLIMVFPRQQRVSLHTFLVFYPLDILLLNSQLNVVEVRKDLRPFSLWHSQREGKYLIELPSPSPNDIAREHQIVFRNP